MAFLATRVLPRMAFTRAPFLTNSTSCWSRSTTLARRSYSSGSAPFQTPLVGDPKWTAMVKNIETYNLQPPLSQTEIKGNQRLYEIEKRMDQITDMLKKIVESNGHLHREMNRVVELLTTQR